MNVLKIVVLLFHDLVVGEDESHKQENAVNLSLIYCTGEKKKAPDAIRACSRRSLFVATHGS